MVTTAAAAGGAAVGHGWGQFTAIPALQAPRLLNWAGAVRCRVQVYSSGGGVYCAGRGRGCVAVLAGQG